MSSEAGQAAAVVTMTAEAAPPVAATPPVRATVLVEEHEDLGAANIGVTSQFGVMAIRHVSDGNWGEAEGLLYPVPLAERDTILTDSRDGDYKTVACVTVAVRVIGKDRPVLRVPNIRGRVLLTESRITFACSKYEKGGGWWGVGDGALLAVPLNIGSHALAAMRRRGKMLVGQVRYPWIAEIHAQNKSGRKGAEILRIVVNAGDKSRLSLDLTFPKDVDATAVGAELIRRAARARLDNDPEPFSDDERARLTELSQITSLDYISGSGKMAGERFPTSWPISEYSARFGTADANRS